MYKQLSALLFIVFSFSIHAEIEIPETIQNQIIAEVITEKGFYDAAEIEERFRLWKLEQPLPRSSGELTDSGNCSGTCIQTGGDGNFPEPRNVKFKGKINDDKFVQNLIIKWKRPQSLPDGSNYKLKNYKIFISKDGVNFEKYKVKAKFKNNGKPKKHQKLKLRGLEIGNYQVQVRAKYKLIQETQAAKSSSNKKGNSSTSLWSDTADGGVDKRGFTVGEIQTLSQGLYDCLKSDRHKYDDDLEVENITNLWCSGFNLNNSDLNAINKLYSLRSLALSDNPNLTDLSNLSHLYLLEYLSVWSNNLDFSLHPDQLMQFDSLETLHIRKEGLTSIPSFPDTVDYVNFDSNGIVDNSGGYFPDHQLDVLKINNNRTYFDGDPSNGAVYGPNTLNDQFIINLVANNVSIKSIEANQNLLTDLSLFAGISGIENLELVNADLAWDQNIEGLSGLCSLKLESDTVGIINAKRPIQLLDVSESPMLRYVASVRSNIYEGNGYYHNYQPLVRNFANNTGLNCKTYYDLIDNQEPYIIDMDLINPFDLPNGQPASIPSCPNINIPSSLTLPDYCSPHVIKFFDVYEDTNTSRRFLKWDKRDGDDYERWGVTHFKISTYLGPQLINVHFQSSDQPFSFTDSDLQPDKYIIQACTEHVCGYEREFNSQIKQGLTKVDGITQHWDDNNEDVSLTFSYSNSIFTDANGMGVPDYFKISPALTQPSGSAVIPNVNVDVVNGQHQYQSTWQSIEFNSDQYFGKTFSIQGCREDLGCGAANTVLLEKPQNQIEVTALTGVQASLINDEIVLTWNTHDLDEGVDYIKIVETQPQMHEGYKAIINSNPNINDKTVTYYTDQITQPFNAKRIINGDYTFLLSACHRIRGIDKDDVCSSTSSVTQIIAKNDEDNYPNPITSVVGGHMRQQSGYWSGYQPANSSDDLYWFKFKYHHLPNRKKAADYFYLRRISGQQCVQKYKNNEDDGGGYSFEALDSFVIDNDNRFGHYIESKSACSFPYIPGEWAVSACFSGIGCGESTVINLSQLTSTPLNIESLSPSVPIQIEQVDASSAGFNSNGVGGIVPGSYWDPQQSGTGWQFHWATHIDGRSAQENEDKDFRVTYDLIAYWFAYTRKKTESQDADHQDQARYYWTPTWYKAKLKRDRNTNYYDGTIYSYSKKNGNSYDNASVGTLVINLDQQDPENYKVVLNIDFEDTAFTTYLSDSTFQTPCGATNNLGHCELTLENINIKLVDGGLPGTDFVPRFGYGNDSDHYSGVWAKNWNEVDQTADVALITTINRGLEVTWVATYDDIIYDNQGVKVGGGEPFWAVSQSCGDECEVSSENYFSGFLNIDENQTDSNIHSIQRGFNPLGFTPSGFWNADTVTPQSVGKLGRCFKETSFNDGKFYLSIDVESTDFEGRNVTDLYGEDVSLNEGKSCYDAVNLIHMEKIAGNHYIGLEVNEENATGGTGLSMCSPGQLNGLGTCAVSFDWYTNGPFSDIAPFFKKGNGPYQQISEGGLCRDQNITIPDGQVVKDFVCLVDGDTQTDDFYYFQLRKKKYELGPNESYSNPDNWETIAQSVPLLIEACPPNGCVNNVDLEPPTVETIDPDITGVVELSMEELMEHFPGDGPIPGQAGVSGGAATYQVPIVIPPAVNGMTPDMSISYSSKAGNGIMGVGWSLSVGSSISRCAATLAQDGYSKSVTFDDSVNGDRLCLDGQKLKVISSIEYWGHQSEYRTEQDSFSKITYNQSNDEFTVYTKSGRTRVYGSFGDFDWLLLNETDTFGNLIGYSYLSEGENEYLLDKITYKGVSNNNNENRYVDFVYEDRIGDYSVSYLHGKKREQTKMLSTLSSYVNTSKIRTYDFSYRSSHASSNTLLESIDETAGTKKRTLFNAQWTDQGWDSDSASQVSYKNIREDVLGHFVGREKPRNITNLKPALDFNGDGIKDLSFGPENLNQYKNAGIVFLDENSEVLKVLDGFGAKDVNRVGPGDINADGINDLIAYDEETGELKFYQWKIGSDLGSSSSLFETFYEEFDLSLDFSQSMINQFDWGVPNKSCNSDTNNYLLNFDPQAAQFYIRDYDQDGMDDILVLVQLKEGRYENTSLNCSWSGLESWQIKSKLILYKNKSTWPVSNNGKATFLPNFDDPVVILENLEPKFERELDTGGIRMFLYDDIKSIDDFNGDGLLDFEIKRLIRARWYNSDAPMVPSLVNHKVYFQTDDGTEPVPRTFAQLGLTGFECLKVGETETDPCDQANTADTGFGPNSLSFVDINSDGLKDVLYYDHAIMSLDEMGERIYDRDIQRNWKVRLNKGGAYDTKIFASNSIDSPIAASSDVVQNFLPQGDVCDNLSAINDAATRKKMHKICNFVFRAGVRYADINADGSNELLFPNPSNLAFNRCMIIGGVSTQNFNGINSTDVCVGDPNIDIFEADPGYPGLNVNKVEECQKMANFNILEALESSTVNPSYDSQITEFMLNNEAHFFGSQGSGCLNGSCTQPPSSPTAPQFPQDPEFISELIQAPAVEQPLACSDSLGDKKSLYEDAGGLNALWDRGVYGFSALDFEVNSDGLLDVSEIVDTGIYSTLFWGGGDDHSGDGISDYYAPVGCMDEPQGYELLGCSDDKGQETGSHWQGVNPFNTLFDGNTYDGYESDGHHILMTRDKNEMPDMLKRVDILTTGQWFEWSYAPISDKSRINFPVYSLPERECQDVDCSADGYIEQQDKIGEYFYFNSSMYVVSELQQNTGIGDVISSNQYAYEEAVYNNQGRGFQGFRKITVSSQPNIDSLQNITESISTFNQIFPLAGKLENVEIIQQVSDEMKFVSKNSYDWYTDNQSVNSSYGVYFNPIENVTTEKYKDDGITVQSKQEDTYIASDCPETSDAYDHYGNNLCSKSTVTSYLKLNSRDGSDVTKSLISETTATKLNVYADPETGVLAADNEWWVDKLSMTKVSSTINESNQIGDYPKPAGYSHSGLTKTQYNHFIWKGNKDRVLECQYTLGIQAGNISSCTVPVNGSQMIKNIFSYDSYGNISEVSSQGEGYINSSASDIESNARDTSSNFDISSGYFANTIDHEGLLTTVSYDKATGQPTLSTDPNGVSTRYEYDEFNFMEQQDVFVDLPGIGEDLLKQPVKSALQSCLRTEVIDGEEISLCLGENTLVNQLINNMMPKVNSLTSNYHGQFYRLTGNTITDYKTPLLVYKTQTRQPGSPMVTQWYDQNNQVVLTKTQHSKTSVSSQDTYTLSLTNHLGQTELVTEPFESDVNWGDSNHPYFTLNVYDQKGRQIEKHQELGQLSDSAGTCWRKTEYIHDGLTTEIDASYVGTGCRTAQNGLNDMSRSYDATGKLRQTVDVNNSITDYWYDSSGNPYMVVDAEENVIKTDFDNLGRKTKVTDPNMGIKSFTYNAFGEVVTSQDANQLASSTKSYYKYDQLGRLIEQYANTSPNLLPLTDLVSYKDIFDYEPDHTYLNGIYRSSNESVGGSFYAAHAMTYEYDDFARVKSQSHAITGGYAGFDVEFEIDYHYYDHHNLLKQTIYTHDRFSGGGYSVINEYDVFGSLTRQRQSPTADDLSNPDDELMRIVEWNHRGQPLNRVLYDNLEMSTEYDYYEGTGQIKQIINHDDDPSNNNNISQQFDYQYDAWGNIATQKLTNHHTISSGITETFTYDQLHRLDTSMVDNSSLIDYEYDVLGNLKKKSDYADTQHYGTGAAGPNAITSSELNFNGGTKYYEYDDAGNRSKDSLGGKTNLYEYDAHNLMTYSRKQLYETPDDDLDQSILFRYGADNQRYLRVEDSIDQAGERTIEATFYAGPVFELVRNDATDETESKFHVTDYLTVTRKNNLLLERHFLQKDRLGSTTQILSESGDVIATKGYDAFGKPRNGDDWSEMAKPALNFEEDAFNTTSTDITKRGFTGHEHLDSFELIHMNGRMYDFNNGRFLSVDPFVHGIDSQGINPYSYILNNPLAGTDPTGYAPDLHLYSALYDSVGPEMAEAIVDAGKPDSESASAKAVIGAVVGAVVVVDQVSDVLAPAKAVVKKIGKEGLKAVTKVAKKAFGNGKDTVPNKPNAKGDVSDIKSQTKQNQENPVGTNRNPNKLSPDPEAKGEHSTFRTDEKGDVTNYETYDKNDRTGDFGSKKRFRRDGKEHGGVEPPVVLERAAGKGAGSRPNVPRKPRKDETPKRTPPKKDCVDKEKCI